MGKIKYRPSHVNSAANPSSNSTSHSTNTRKPAIIRSSFCPSLFQLSLFASVIRSLDAEHLRVHDTRTGQIRCDYAIDPSTSVTCLAWGLYGRSGASHLKTTSSKKRKRSSAPGSVAPGDVVIAYGTKDSQIELFSPDEAKVVGTLKDGHTGGVRDFRFSGDGSGREAWSIGGDSRLVQWDLESGQPKRSISMPTGLASVLEPIDGAVLCASHLAYYIEPDSKSDPPKFNASTNLVRLMLAQKQGNGGRQRFVTAAQNDRYMNIFELGSTSLIGSLLAEAEVTHADLAELETTHSMDLQGNPVLSDSRQGRDVLAIINKDGVLELFINPFEVGTNAQVPTTNSAKLRAAQRSRKSPFQYRFLTDINSNSPISPVGVLIHGKEIIVALAEAGTRLSFQRVEWQDQRQGLTDVLVSQTSRGHSLAAMNGMKDTSKTQIDESHAIISNGIAEPQTSASMTDAEVIDISSAEEETESSEDENLRLPDRGKGQHLTNGVHSNANGAVLDASLLPAAASEDVSMVIDNEEPSFGEKLRAAANATIDVEDAFVGTGQQGLIPIADQTVRQVPSGISLGTVLTQSLRTNDKDLLQTCFQVKDMAVVRATIERLDSNIAPSLVQRLVERFHSRPGRAGSLMVWIQWTLAAHGGYLTTRPEVLRNLLSLRRVVQERANSLPLLLSLKGKLDLLEAQKNLRENMHSKAQALGERSEKSVVYVEGQSESESESDEHDFVTTTLPQTGDIDTPSISRGTNGRTLDLAFSADSEDSGAEMPLANGDVSSAGGESDVSENGGFFDEEASSTDQDSGDDISEEVDDDDVDTGSSDGAPSPPPKRRARLSNAR